MAVACFHLEPAWSDLSGVSTGECSVVHRRMSWISLFVQRRVRELTQLVEVEQWQTLQLCGSQVISCFEAL